MKRKPRLDTYAVIACAVEEGVATGIRRFLKYESDRVMQVIYGKESALNEKVYNEVMNALSDVLIYEERDHGK
jgi:hypothetical protein